MRMPKVIAVIAIFIFFVTLSACMKHYGRLTIDSEVKRDFQAGVIRPGLQYYYTGRPTMPYAIVGIDRHYSLPSKLWISIAPDSNQLSKMSKKIYQKERVDPRGAVINGPDGKTLGIWYSNLYNYSIHVDPQARTVQILYANPEVNDQPGW